MPTVSDAITRRFAEFQADPLQQFRVRLRRQRAGQLREMLASSNDLTLEGFNKDVWRLESQTLLHNQPIKTGEIFSVDGVSDERLRELDDAFTAGALEFHGNSIWGSGTRVYGASLQNSDAEKLANIREAARILTAPAVAPIDKATALIGLPGFGPNIATGLVMVFHPSEFALWNQVSQRVLASLGGETSELAGFERDVQSVRAAVNAEDFLELDWFFYLLNHDQLAAAPNSSERSYWVLGARPDIYDIEGAVAALDRDVWRTGGGDVQVGDRFALWKFKGREKHRGIVALGEVMSAPTTRPIEPNAFNRKQEDGPPQPCVDVRYVQMPEGPIWLDNEPWLGELSVANAQGGTAFHVTPEQWQRLMDLVGGWPERARRGVWWVNQRASFKQERAGGYLWAPLADKAGRRPSHWENMGRAQAGDIVLSYASGRLRAVSRVLAAAVAAKQPEELEQRWNDDGQLLRVQYADLDPIELARIPVEWRQAEGPGSPFDRDGGVNQGYLFHISDGFLERLADAFPTLENALADLEGRQIQQRTWCIYVPRSGASNFHLARAAATWGAPQEGRLTGIRPDDRLVFVHDLKSDLSPAPSGFPRVPLDLFHGIAGVVLEAEAVSAPFVDSETIWPNEPYPERVRFRELNEQHEVPINTDAQPVGIVEATRRSALAGGRPILAEGVEKPVTPFDVEAVQTAAADKGLQLDPAIVAQLMAALESGKHVILTGPPGTAKTTLAEVVAEVATKAGRCTGHLLTTATADWTTYETIGGLRPDGTGELTFEQGHFLDAIATTQWLVIDELNRSNFDRAFGQLFTVLSGQAVELPYRARRQGRSHRRSYPRAPRCPPARTSSRSRRPGGSSPR